MRRPFLLSLALAFLATGPLLACSTGVKAGGRLGADAHVKWDNGPDVGGGVTLPDVSVNGSAVPGALPGTKAAPPAPVIVQPPAPDCSGGMCDAPGLGVAADERIIAGLRMIQASIDASAMAAGAARQQDADRIATALDRLAPTAAVAAAPPAKADDDGHGFLWYAGHVTLYGIVGLATLVLLALGGILGGAVGKGIRALWRKAFGAKSAAPKPATP